MRGQEMRDPQMYANKWLVIIPHAGSGETYVSIGREDNLKQKVFDFSDAEMRNLRKSAAAAGLSITESLRRSRQTKRFS